MINGMNLYGWLVISVIAISTGFVIKIPEIIMDILFAYLLFFARKNKPTITGIKNITIIESNRIWYENDVKPIQKCSKFQLPVDDPANAVVAPIIIIPVVVAPIIILFFIGMSALIIKNIDNGKNVAVNGFENSDNTYDAGDNIHVLWIIK